MQPHHHPTQHSDTGSAPFKRPKMRGSYNCGRCGQPKKGHSCHLGPSDAIPTPSPTPFSPIPPRHHQNLRRSLSFDDDNVSTTPEGLEPQDDDPEAPLPFAYMAEVLMRLPPAALLSAAQVCKGWRDCARRVWRAAEELRLRVPARTRVGFVGSVLRRCTGLLRLSLSVESDVDATMLACVAFSCSNLEALEIHTSDYAVNRITGEELGHFVAEKRCLSSLKIEGCANLGSLNLCSLSLSTLWLSELHSISRTVFSCPNLKELSLDFSRQENDNTDLINMVDNLGRSCPKLRNIHIASIRLSHAVVLALTSANLRGLRMLSLVLGSAITDASVAAITSSYANLELLDLSGSSISDSGIGMICNVLPQTLSKLLLALCPNVTSSGIQFAAAQLPYLQLIDCGMSICDPNVQNADLEENEADGSDATNHHQKVVNAKVHPMYQKLIIKHERLRKLSLWGCSGLDALYLNCPELNDLNLTSCSNLHPERLLLQCPRLENVHASECPDKLIGAIQSQVYNEFAAEEDHFPCKRLADGSKRVKVPNFLLEQTSDDKKGGRRVLQQRCTVHVS